MRRALAPMELRDFAAPSRAHLCSFHRSPAPLPGCDPFGNEIPGVVRAGLALLPATVRAAHRAATRFASDFLDCETFGFNETLAEVWGQ